MIGAGQNSFVLNTNCGQYLQLFVPIEVQEAINLRVMSQLPDPTADLNWSGYAGAIHEIFRRQAEANPDRVCVTETRSSTTPERSFTYRQISEASNTLAHYLHDAGITNGDVVMIWAHRSVDLVVSLMGILVRTYTRNAYLYANTLQRLLVLQ